MVHKLLELSNFISNMLYQQKSKSMACEIFQLNFEILFLN